MKPFFGIMYSDYCYVVIYSYDVILRQGLGGQEAHARVQPVDERLR